MPQTSFERAGVTGLVALGIALVVACGSRSPLDVAERPAAPLDAAAPDASLEAAVPVPVPVPVDAGREAGLLDCGVCLANQCSTKMSECIQSAPCRDTFQCILQNCLAGGGLDTPCLFKCGGGNPAGAIQALGVFQCVTQDCGSDCNPLIGALGGGDAGTKKPAPFRRALASWPELGGASEDAE